MSGIVKSLGGIVNAIAPVLDLVQAIPGLGSIVGVAKSAFSIISQIDQVFSDFPKGLVNVALKAAGEILPVPGKQILDMITNPGQGLFNLLPDAVKNFLPSSLTPAVPGALNDLISDWL